MDSNSKIKDIILKNIADIKEKTTPKTAKMYNLEQTERIVHRLFSFSNNCSDCKNHLESLDKIISTINRMNDADENSVFKEYKKIATCIIAHLQKEHNLVPEGHYAGIYMSYGIALSLPFGLVFVQLMGSLAYMSIGLPIGLAIGLSIGSGMDEKAKKKGLII